MAKWWNFVSKVATSGSFFPSLSSWCVRWYPLDFRCLGSADCWEQSSVAYVAAGWPQATVPPRTPPWVALGGGQVSKFCHKSGQKRISKFFIFSCGKCSGLSDLGTTRSIPGWRTWRLGDVWRQCRHVRHRGRPWGAAKC